MHQLTARRTGRAHECSAHRPPRSRCAASIHCPCCAASLLLSPAPPHADRLLPPGTTELITRADPAPGTDPTAPPHHTHPHHTCSWRSSPSASTAAGRPLRLRGPGGRGGGLTGRMHAWLLQVSTARRSYRCALLRHCSSVSACHCHIAPMSQSP